MSERETRETPSLQFDMARPEDADLLLSFIQKYYAFDHIAFEASSIARGIAVLLADPSLGEAWFVRSNAKTIGYFILTFGFDLEFGGRQATLTDLFLDSNHRGRGIGQATLAHVEKLLVERGVGALELQVEEENRVAFAMYERFGFKAHRRIPMSKQVATRSS